MLDKDKLWLEYRIGVKGLSVIEASDLIAKIGHDLRNKDDSVMQIFVPDPETKSCTVRLIYDPTGQQNEEQLKLAREYMQIVIEKYKLDKQ